MQEFPSTLRTPDDAQHSWVDELSDSRPVRMAFGGTPPALDDVAVRALELERRGAGPRALVSIEFFDLGEGLPAKWNGASSGGIRLVLEGVTQFSFEGWPSNDRAPLVLQTVDETVFLTFDGSPTKLSIRAATVMTDKFSAYDD